jgi:6-phosphogluconate dehydrogenase (decarboxylating)
MVEIHTDTDRRFTALSAKGFTFGMGIRRRKGARFGPSLMPGGNKEAYERLRPIFESIAAKGEPCRIFRQRIRVTTLKWLTMELNMVLCSLFQRCTTL